MSESSVKNVKLTPVQSLGVDLTVRYGVTSKLVTFTAKEGRERLSLLVRRSAQFLQSQQQKFTSKHEAAAGFDWFLSTIFIMMNGNSERTWNFIHQFSTLLPSAYLWPQRLHASVLVY